MDFAIAIYYNSHMSGFTPLNAPGVTDNPVFGTCAAIDIPADNSHCVVDIINIRAAELVEDILLIVIEERINLNDCGDRAISKSVFMIRDEMTIDDLYGNFASIKLAVALDSDVRVIT